MPLDHMLAHRQQKNSLSGMAFSDGPLLFSRLASRRQCFLPWNIPTHWWASSFTNYKPAANPKRQSFYGVIEADRCWFSKHSCHMELSNISGEISYGSLMLLSSDLMGPFRFFPMERRYGVLSMAPIQGSVIGHLHRFDGGLGYAEKTGEPPFRAPTCGCSATIFRNHALA